MQAVFRSPDVLAEDCTEHDCAREHITGTNQLCKNFWDASDNENSILGLCIASLSLVMVCCLWD